MKIIIVNYRYFVSGGPETYLFNVTELLKKNGHEIVPFSIKNKRNRPSQYENYFIEPVGENHEVYFREYKKTNLKTILKLFAGMFYSFEARKKLNRLIKAVKPDLIYVLNYQNKISASIFDAAAKNRIPVIHRVSDFGQICANGLFFRPKQQDICERCLTGSKFNAVLNKCVHDSYFYSLIKIAALKFQELLGVRNKVEAFVVPSKFTYDRLKAFGFLPNSLVHIASFFNFDSVKKELHITYESFALYIGRIEPEKGLFTLIKAFENTNFRLKIIGFSTSNFDEELKHYLVDKNHNIEFLGKKEFDEIQNYLSKCSFTIVPSEWYDNLPNTVLESFAFEKCVVATNTGSLKEMVVDNETGLLFRIKDFQDLRSKLTYLFENRSICEALGKNAYNALTNKFSAREHYEKLINLFGKAVDNNQSKIAG